MKKLLLVLVVCAAVVSCAQAQNVFQWFGGEPANSDWNFGMNWKDEFTGTFGVVPDATAKVKINNVKWGSIAEPLINEAVTIGDVFIAEAGAGLSPETMHVGVGGSLLVQGANPGVIGNSGQINIAYQLGAVGGLDINGGSVVVKGPVHVGWGGAGSLVIGGGGSLTATAIDIAGDLIATGTGSILFTAVGTTSLFNELLLSGDNTAQIQGFLDNGQLTTSVVGGTFVNEFMGGKTHVYVVPEPITLSLLSLGGLLLRKRS